MVPAALRSEFPLGERGRERERGSKNSGSKMSAPPILSKTFCLKAIDQQSLVRLCPTVSNSMLGGKCSARSEKGLRSKGQKLMVHRCHLRQVFLNANVIV